MNYECFSSASGLGDAVCAVYAVNGMARYMTGDHFTLYTSATQVPEKGPESNWLKRVIMPPNVQIKHPKQNSILLNHTQMGTDLSSNYSEQLREARSRKQWYVDSFTAKHELPPMVPMQPETYVGGSEPPTGFIAKSYVVLAPYSDWHWRMWPMLQWVKLASELTRSGWKVIVIGLDKHKDEMARNFGDTSVTYFWGQTAEWVTDTILNAALVIGNDSGIPHVAGLYNVPAIAVMAHLPSRMVFSHSDVMGVMPTAGCSPCSWVGHRGWIPSCDNVGCAALSSIGFDTVHQKAIGLLRNQR